MAVGGATFAAITTITLYIIAYAAIILIIALHSATRQARNLSSLLFALVARKALVCGVGCVGENLICTASGLCESFNCTKQDIKRSREEFSYGELVVGADIESSVCSSS